jgi:pilus assembly protein Flp/PilA
MPFSSKESGQGLVEYALIMILVVIIVFIIFSLLGPAIGNWLSQFIDSIKSEIIYLVA